MATILIKVLSFELEKKIMTLHREVVFEFVSRLKMMP